MQFLAQWCVVIVLAQSAPGATDEVRSLKLTIATPREKYLLGEPVPLRGALRNVGKEPFRELRADLPVRHHALDIVLSEDGVHFGKELRLSSGGKVKRTRQTLNPNEEWVFEVRVVWTGDRPSRLAIERPGEHFVKVGYPLMSRGMGQRVVVESNVLRVVVVAPEGDDLKVWDQINRPDFVYFLDSGMGRAEVARQAFDLVRTFPKSGYQDALRHALGAYYEQRRGRPTGVQGQQGPDLEDIRRLLGIPKADQPAPVFPQDRRLDVQVGYHFPEQTPLAEVLKLISQLGGVPLRAAPELEVRTLATIPRQWSLRESMRSLEDSQSAWVREEDGGYRLVPVVRPGLLPSTPPRPPKPKPAKPADGK